MKNVLLRAVFAATVLTVFGCSTAQAQVNSWTKPASGYWEEVYWSLGVAPAPDHTIMFTNEGWKALAIGPTTLPATLQITRLTVSSPTNSFNTLLLNYAGVQKPLRISENFYLGSNSVLLSLASGLQVSNEFQIDGTVNQGDFSEIKTRMLVAGSNNPAAYNLSNGVLSVREYMFVGYGQPATFTQEGGFNSAGNIRFRNGGQYLLHGGDLTAGRMAVGDQSVGSFEQTGGQVRFTNGVWIGGDGWLGMGVNIGSGRYTLDGGTLQTPRLAVGLPRTRLSTGGDGVFDQSGGSVSAHSLSVGAHRLPGTYNLAGGELVTSNSAVISGGGFSQSGGTHLIDEALTLRGEYERAFEPIYAGYSLSNGFLRARTLGIYIAGFSQTGGTNDIAGDLVLEREFGGAAHSSYYLSGGGLNTYNTIVNPTSHGGFTQSGGVHSIIGTLDLRDSSGPFSLSPSLPVLYTLLAGQLIVDDIRVSAHAIFHQTGGTINHSGFLTLAGGTWESGPGANPFGVLVLESGPTNSSLVLPDSTTSLRFAASSSAAWASDARLLIHNWRGSTNGSGMHRVIFGTSPSGLSPQQLAQIRFRNPAGFPVGDYSARILSTGEIVPVSRPPISHSRNGHQLVLQWPSGWTLQTATNISGPFSDVNASNSYTNSTASGAQRYFRLRQ
jgi:hypothetical protein